MSARQGLEEKFKRLPEPVLTRWWLVGECAVVFKASKEIWSRVLQSILTYAKSNSASSKIALSTLGLLKKPTICCNHKIICAFHCWFLFPNFKYFQFGDVRMGGTLSFKSRHILVQFFIMITDLDDKWKGDKWKQKDEFKDVVTSLGKCANQDKEMQTNKVTIFLEVVQKSIVKHFKKWVDSPLLFYEVFSESPSACVLAHFLLGINYNGPKSFQGQEHGATVNLAEFSAFIKENCSTVNLKKVLDLPQVKKSWAELLMIKQKIDMWDTKQDNLPLGQFWNKFLRNSGGLGREKGVKESGCVSLG